MPLAECNICNRRFHGKFSLRALGAHARTHKNHDNVSKEPVRRLSVKDLDLKKYLDEHKSLSETADMIWAILPLHKRCSLLATFFIEQSHDSNPGGPHDNDTVDGEILSEHRAG